MADSPTLGPHELYAYEPPVSLWQLVTSYVPHHELQEIKYLLGESLVEQSLELHQEVGTLLEIWRDFRSETENNLMYNRLPEPPAARERLKHEIKFFIDSIREKSESNGSNFNDIITKHSKSVLDYVLENKNPENSCGSRPSTARSSRDGRETPMTITTPDRLCKGSMISQDMDSMKDNLNFLQLDSVVQHLRDTLEEEVQWLLKDIDFLQNCLSDEADFRTNPTISREPSLADLRAERSKLEKDLLTDDLPRALRDPTISTPRRKSSLSERTVKSHPRVTPPSTPSGGRPTPMRASHQIATQVLTIARPGDDTEAGDDRQKTSSGAEPRRGSYSRPTRGSPVSGHTPNSPDHTPKSPAHTPNSHRHLPEPPSHIAVRTGSSPKVVKVGSIPLSRTDVALHSPSPPSSSKPSAARPGSANRFRRMVLECRDGT